MDPLVLKLSETPEGRVNNPHMNMRPRFITINGVVQYLNHDFALPEGIPGSYPYVEFIHSMLVKDDVLGFHY